MLSALHIWHHTGNLTCYGKEDVSLHILPVYDSLQANDSTTWTKNVQNFIHHANRGVLLQELTGRLGNIQLINYTIYKYRKE